MSKKKVFRINSEVVYDLSECEVVALLAAHKVCMLLHDGKYTHKCVQELKGAIGALGPRYFVECDE